MTKFKIALVCKTQDTPLVNFLLQQLQGIEWIACKAYNLTEAAQAIDNDFFLTILENTSFAEILDICQFYRNNKNRALYIAPWNKDLILGPTHFPTETAGADSCFLFLKQDEMQRTPQAEELYAITTPVVDAGQLQKNRDAFYTIMADLINELKLIYADKPGEKLKFIDNIAIFPLGHMNKKTATSKYIYPLFEDATQQKVDPYSPEYKVLLSKYLHSVDHIEDRFFVDRPMEGRPEGGYRNVAIVGGGTAGYLTALALKKAFPALPVTLIESSKIPVIGVGEATTPEIRRFLFGTLGFSPLDFYKKVKPSWKLGIKFFWGLPGDYYFNYPFGKSDIRSAYLINNDINHCSLTSLLMSNNSSFVIAAPDKEQPENHLSLSNDITYALHLDNVSFIRYLKEQAIAAGVTYTDDLIIDAERKTDSNEILSVRGESGQTYEFDFFVDCSGFKSLMIEKILGSRYTSFNKSLFTDMAVTGCIPNRDKVRPYTLAESMNNGWCWNIPMRGEDHRGYVFSSDFCTVDQAAAELQAKNPDIVDLKTVKFRSGRHEEICIGNVFAIGNSYAFVEPLESTGIHMIIKEIEALTRSFAQLKFSPAIRKVINSNMNGHWDYLKGFLSIHYKFNKKFQTEFWKECRENTDVSSIQWLIDLYHEVGLLSYSGEAFNEIITREIKDDIFGLLGFDTLLLGQGVVPRRFDKMLRNKSVWDANVSTWKSIQSMTVPLEEDLRILTTYPELI